MSDDIPGVDTLVDDGVLRVTINRPARMNAVTTETLEAIAEAFEKHAGDASVRVAVLTGSGRAFCTGADLSTVDSVDGPSPATIDAANRTVAAIRTFPRPVIGAVNGPAAGSASAGAVLRSDGRGRIDLLPARVHQDRADAGRRRVRAGRRVDRTGPCAEDGAARRAPAFATEAVAGLIADTYPDDGYADAIEALVQRIADGLADALGFDEGRDQRRDPHRTRRRVRPRTRRTVATARRRRFPRGRPRVPGQASRGVPQPVAPPLPDGGGEHSAVVGDCDHRRGDAPTVLSAMSTYFAATFPR